jgi:hypothetical protein
LAGLSGREARKARPGLEYSVHLFPKPSNGVRTYAHPVFDPFAIELRQGPYARITRLHVVRNLPETLKLGSFVSRPAEAWL